VRLIWVVLLRFYLAVTTTGLRTAQTQMHYMPKMGVIICTAGEFEETSLVPESTRNWYLCSRDVLFERIANIRPQMYDQTHNCLVGSVTGLSNEFSFARHF